MSELITRRKLVGLFGGSFDPPHRGHVQLVEQALRQLPLDEVWVMPVGVPVHRQLSDCASVGLRLAWLERLFTGISRVKVMDWEARQTKPTASIDTLRRMVDEGVQPVFLMGADAYAGMPGWVGYPEHRQLCSVAVFARVGQSRPELSGWLKGDLATPGHVQWLQVDLADVSATRIRELAAAGEPLSSLVPDALMEDIERCYGRADDHETPNGESRDG